MAERPKLLKDAPGVDPIIREMHAQNDRGAAITGGVYLESKIKDAIVHQWPQVAKRARDTIFEGYGPLSTFSAKIDVAFAMGVLNIHSKADCHKVRRIRNHAAHVGTPFEFTDPGVKTILDGIQCAKVIPIDVEPKSEERNQFTTAVKVLTVYLFFQEHWKKKFGPKAVMPDYNEELVDRLNIENKADE